MVGTDNRIEKSAHLQDDSARDDGPMVGGLGERI
jgi:hypothetical protein